MKKYSIYMIAIAVLTLAWGCSSDDNNNDGGNNGYVGNIDFARFEEGPYPYWDVDMSDTQEAPQWTPPDPAKYEHKMIAQLRLQNELTFFSSDDDRMAVFVGDECRALSQRSGTEQEVYFVLNVHGNSAYDNEEFSLCYYCAKLKQLFVLTGENTFRNELTLGIDTEFSPNLMNGSTKYPVKTTMTIYPVAYSSDASINEEYDMVAVFVGDECRGVGKPDQPFTAFSYNAEEEAHICYYSYRKRGIYTSQETIQLSGGEIFYGLDYK